MAEENGPAPTPLYRALLGAIGPLVRAYSRVEVRGKRNLPAAGGAILAANHPGSLWWDALCLGGGMAPRPISFVANAWDFRVPLMGRFLRGVGAFVQAADPTAIGVADPIVAAAREGRLVCHFPEEAYHTFWQRYTVYRFVPHTLLYADWAQVPIIPTAIVGVEEAAATLVGFKPAGAPLHFPLIPPLVLPLKVVIEFGEPVTASELIGGPAPHTPQAYAAGASHLRDRVARLLASYRRVRTNDLGYLDHRGWW